MLRKLTVVTAITIMSFAYFGCYSAPIMPPPGLIFMNIEAPASLGKTDLGSRNGRASSRSLLGLIAWGDCSIKEAADSGGVTSVKHVDYDFFNLLGIYQSFTTVVYGD